MTVGDGQPLVFASVTWNGFANAVLSCAVCGVPPASISSFGGFDAGHERAVAGCVCAAGGLSILQQEHDAPANASRDRRACTQTRAWVAVRKRGCVRASGLRSGPAVVCCR